MSDSPMHCAALSALVAPPIAEIERVEAFIAGGGGSVRREAVRLEAVSVAVAPGGVRLECAALAYHGQADYIEDCPRVVFLEVVPSAIALPISWRGWERLEAEITNGPVAMEIELTVFGSRSRLLERRAFAPGETATLAVALADIGLIQGNMATYEPQSIRLAFFLPEGGPAGSCDLTRLALAGQHVHGAVIDRWGQRIHTDWPGKIRSDADLITVRDAETELLQRTQPPAERGRYGGWTGGVRFAASGFFHVEQDAAGRWWYVDPEGLPFWSTGPTGIRLGDATITQGREELFAELPPQGGLDVPALSDGKVSYYAQNVLRKYGSQQAWLARQRERMHAWGSNTLANWCDPRVAAGGGIAYVRTLSSRTTNPLARPHLLPDIGTPGWEEALRAQIATEVAPDDPWLIGYFVDNELPWNKLAPDEAARYAEKYFSTIRRVLKEADPNHLYLGCRFVRNMPARIIPEIAGRYVDVLSVNAYSIIPLREQFDEWYAAAGKPIQIGEHQFALRDPRGPITPWMALTATERQRAVCAYSQAAAQLPYCIGTHWFQFEDQPVTGRPSNGENMLIGVVDITDTPYPHMVAAFREISAQCYAWHGEG